MNGGHEILEGLPDASGLPQPLRRSLDLIQEQGTMAARHDQVLHAFGALLRLLTSVVCARYLRQEGSRLQIDRSLASNMRRPSLGHHLDFLRHCCMATDQDWGPVQPLLREVSALTLRGPDNPMVGLVEARNRTFHGARVLDEKIAGTALGPLVALLKDAVESLPALRTIQVHEGESLELLLGGVPMAWVPLAEAGDGPRIGLLEGWAERPAHLRFVGADHDWNSDRGWTEWASLLRKRSLLPTVLGDVTEAWLRGRALALRPSQCLWPDSGAMAEELLADAQRLSASGECPARDPWLAAMALTLLHEAQGRIVYVLPPGEAGQAGDAVGYFSETLGLLTPLDAVPTGHPVEVLLARVDLVLVLPTPALRRQWQELAGLVPGMRVHAVLPAWEAPAPFRSLGPLQHPLLAWRLAQAGATESQVPPDDPAWLRQVAGIHTFVETVAAGDAPPHSAFSHWRCVKQHLIKM